MNPYRGWEIYPKIMFDMGMRMKEEYGNMNGLSPKMAWEWKMNISTKIKKYNSR